MTVAATVPVPGTEPVRLWPWSIFAALLASAGLPIYIHAPKAYVDMYDVPLAALGAVLFGLRLLDVVQDPVLGRIAGRLQNPGLAAVLAVAVMAAAMLGLFAVTPPIAPLWWFALMLALVFTAFSFLTILFYATGVRRAADLGPSGHVVLARWRETGALLGICAASVAPLVLGGFGGFALAFAVLAVLGAWAMRSEWRRADVPDSGFAIVLADPVARRLLLTALLNAAPVAVTSTLFLFFVESLLQAPGAEGPLLLLFFLSAAVAAPVWSRLAETHGVKRMLLAGMALSIVTFAFALTLGEGDTIAFAVICVASGAALGADMTLLPALFAARMAKVAPGAASAFGLWSFVSKLALALAAITLLPALDRAGFAPGTTNDATALRALLLAYAGLPCLLKIAAILLLFRTKGV